MSAAKEAQILADQRLAEIYDWLIEQIDGGEECRGRDSELTRMASYVEGARELLAAYQRYADGVTAMVASPGEAA